MLISFGVTLFTLSLCVCMGTHWLPHALSLTHTHIYIYTTLQNKMKNKNEENKTEWLGDMPLLNLISTC